MTVQKTIWPLSSHAIEHAIVLLTSTSNIFCHRRLFQHDEGRGCSINTHCLQPYYSVEDSLITTKEYGSEGLHKLNGAEAFFPANDGGEGYRSFLGLVSVMTSGHRGLRLGNHGFCSRVDQERLVWQRIGFAPNNVGDDEQA